MFLVTDIDKMGIYLYFVVNQSENMQSLKKKLYFLDNCGLDTFKLINFIFLSKNCTSSSVAYIICVNRSNYIIILSQWKIEYRS